MLFPTGFTVIVSWLSPLFGTSLRIALSEIFVLLGDPFVYSTLLILWIVVGFLGGLILQKRIGSILVTVSVYTSQFLILALAGFNIYKIASNMGFVDLLSSPSDLLNIIPPMPAGSNISALLSAPIIGDLAGILTDIQLSSINPSTLITTILTSVLINAAKNLIIITMASFLGCEVGKFLYNSFRPQITHLRSILPKLSFFSTDSLKNSRRILYTFGITLLLFGSLLTTSIIYVSGFGSSYYAEYLFTPIHPNGDVYVRTAILDNQHILKNVDFTGEEFQNCISAILMTHGSSTSSINPDITLLLGSLPSWIPRDVISQNLEAYFSSTDTLFIALYDDLDLSTADSRAAQVANLFSSRTDISLSPLASFQQLIGESYESIIIYSSMTPFSSAGESIIGLLPADERNGLCDWISTVWDGGILSPGRLRNSAESTLIVLGYGESSSIRNLLGGGLGLVTDFLPTTDMPFAYLTLSSYFPKIYHSSPIVDHQLDITELIGLNDPIIFSPQSNISAIINVVPEGNTSLIQIITTASEEFADQISESLTDMFGLTSSVQIDTVSLGSMIDLNDIAVDFTFRFPLKLKIEKSITMDEIDRYQQVTVTIKIINNDVDPAENIRLDDSASLTYYPNAKVISGSLTQNWEYIPRATASGPSILEHIYVISLDKEGIYTLKAASISYTYKNAKFYDSSNSITVKVRPPSLFQVFIEGIPQAWRSLSCMIELIPIFKGNGSLILTTVVFISVAVLLLMETNNRDKLRSFLFKKIKGN